MHPRPVPLAAGLLLGLGLKPLLVRLRFLYISRARRRRLPHFLSDQCVEAKRLRGGVPFDAHHPDVWPMLRAAKDLCDEYNFQPLGARSRAVVLADLFGSAPTGPEAPHIEAPVHVDYGCHIHVGKNFYCNHGCILLDGAKITIGDNVFLAPNVQLYTAEHPLDHAARRDVEHSRPITIGSDVWIGGGAIVLPGVTIGSRSVVAAGAVVTRDVQPDTIVAGCPARVIRDLHADPPVFVPRPAMR